MIRLILAEGQAAQPVDTPDFSIITPSRNMLGYLRRCAMSIRDQADVTVEHIVVDALSKDGTREWLDENDSIHAIIGPDAGMYDALNKGLSVAQGRFLAYLNCDEQYLPGTLSYVKSWLDRSPTVNLLFGDTLIINPEGELLAFRKGFAPWWPMMAASHMYLHSSSMFFRREVIDSGHRFDNRLRIAGDRMFCIRALRDGHKGKHVRRYFSVFTMTGHNLGAGDYAAERALLYREFPPWISFVKLPLNGLRYLLKAAAGCYREEMVSYDIYTDVNLETRIQLRDRRASYKWPGQAAVNPQSDRRDD